MQNTFTTTPAGVHVGEPWPSELVVAEELLQDADHATPARHGERIEIRVANGSATYRITHTDAATRVVHARLVESVWTAPE